MLRIFVLAACLAGGVSYTVPTSRQVAARRATMLFPRALSPTASITGLDKGEPEVDIMEVPLLPCPPSTSRHGPCVPLRPGPAPEDALHNRVGARSRPQPVRLSNPCVSVRASVRIVVASRTSSSYSHYAHILHALPKQMIRQDRIKEAERNILFLLPVAFLSSYAFYMALISL